MHATRKDVSHQCESAHFLLGVHKKMKRYEKKKKPWNLTSQPSKKQVRKGKMRIGREKGV